MSTVVKWIRQNKPPIVAGWALSNPILINHSQILLAYIPAIREYVVFWIYNTSKLEWECITTKEIFSYAGAKIAYDKQTKSVYFLYNNEFDSTDIAVYDIEKNLFKKCGISIPFDDEILGASLDFFDGKLNIILGNCNDKHYECDIKQKECKQINTFEIYSDGLSGPTLIHLQKREMVWLIGGFDYDTENWSCSNDIHTYSIKDKQWIMLDLKLPLALRASTGFCTIDQRYIVLFDGSDSRYVASDKIYIIDTEYGNKRIFN